MPNAFWYILLALINMSLFGYTLWKIRDRKLVALYTFMSGVTFGAEFLFFVLLGSYVYQPHILRDSYFDSVMGSFVSNAVTVPMTSVLFAGFQLHWFWSPVAAGAVSLVEELFLHLHIYEHNWWRTPYTFVGLIVWFEGAKQLYRRLRPGLSGPLHYLIVYMTTAFLHASLVFVVIAFFGAYHYEIGWFQDKTRDHVAFATIYILLLSHLIAAAVAFRFRWLWRVLILLLTIVPNWILLRLHVLHLSPGWSLLHSVLLRLAVLILVDWFDRFTLGEGPQADTRT